MEHLGHGIQGITVQKKKEATMNNRFSYLLKKIENAEFLTEPFQHINIFDFFNNEDFQQLLSLNQIKLKECENLQELIYELHSKNYEPILFPGSITSEKDYIKFAENGNFNRRLIKGYGRKVIEGYGITYRLKKYQSEFLAELMEFFEGDELRKLLISPVFIF